MTMATLSLKITDKLDLYSVRSIKVGMGEYAISTDPHILSTWALGSCMALIIYEPIMRIGGLAHAMLPSSKGKQGQPGRYVDSAVELMIETLCQMGAKKRNLASAAVGGATIFNFSGELAIGKKNIDATREQLNRNSIPMIFKEMGGNRGRNVVFDLATGEILVSVSKPPLERREQNGSPLKLVVACSAKSTTI